MCIEQMCKIDAKFKRINWFPTRERFERFVFKYFQVIFAKLHAYI